MKPTIGRIVLYVLCAADADAINASRKQLFAHPTGDSNIAPSAGAFIHQGNVAQEGDICPADVIRVWGEDENPPVNLQVKLDGNDTYWATSRHEDDSKAPGTWHWMEYQKQQAVKVSDQTAGPELLADPIIDTDPHSDSLGGQDSADVDKTSGTESEGSNEGDAEQGASESTGTDETI